ncbi:NADH dehydrogenase [ubiquinone] 1 beta subcomplex subunit NP15.6 [Ptiloglossa arizonensis]|uniref:NADH dehydrogenase [ubiquinone] 1 beta subcomplex subunit NP15.6 n=1 Tax=Ptiloglossa arizonensis TaxID=3350558 RepID=UPI003F9FA155
MSTLLRLIRSEGIKNRLTFLVSKDVKVYNTVFRSTSVTKQDKDVPDIPFKQKRTWVSYGFSETNEREDRHYMHATYFSYVTVALIFGAFVLAYLPDPTLRDWAQREAHLQVRYREEHGLPLLDPNLIDPSKFTLPTDEELGNTEIII